MAKDTKYVDLQDFHTLKTKNFDLINLGIAEQDHFSNLKRFARNKKEERQTSHTIRRGVSSVPCTVYGWDVAARSIGGLDMDGAFGKREAEGWGGYLDPKWPNIRSFLEIKEMFENN